VVDKWIGVRHQVKLIAGLGNPPREYGGTRHNVGANVVDILAERLRIDTWRGRWYSLTERRTIGEIETVLLKPMTFMNRSGRAVSTALRDLELDPADLMVVVDDVHLELGRLRLRRGGSAGGHLGLESIGHYLHTLDFPRLRIGVGCPVTRSVLRDHVLSGFSEDERQILAPRLTEAADALEDFVRHGIDHAMNAHNA